MPDSCIHIPSALSPHPHFTAMVRAVGCTARTIEDHLPHQLQWVALHAGYQSIDAVTELKNRSSIVESSLLQPFSPPSVR
ncbi:unnamed protein product [Victoria cruziana]